MYRKILLFAIALSTSHFLPGQKLTWMPKGGEAQEKFASPRLGAGYVRYLSVWDDKGIIAHDLNWLYVIDRQSLAVKSKFKREDALAKKEEYVGHLRTKDGLGALVVSPEGSGKELEFKIKFVPIGGAGFGTPKELFSVPKGRFGNILQIADHITVSEDLERVLVLVPDGEELELRVYDGSFQQLYSKAVPMVFAAGGKRHSIMGFRAFVDGKGNACLSGLVEEQGSKEEGWQRYSPFFLGYNREKDKVAHHVFEVGGGGAAGGKAYLWSDKQKLELSPRTGKGLDNECLVNLGQKLRFGHNPATGVHIIGGLFDSPDGGGFFTVQYDPVEDLVLPLKRHKIPAGIKREIEQKSFEGKEAKGWLFLQDILPKEDGSFVVLLEVDESVYRQLSTSSPTISWLKCHDIIYQNIDRDNSATFSGSIHKKQEARNEKNGSFAASCDGSTVHIVFNTYDGKSENDLAWYAIDANGRATEKGRLPIGLRLRPVPYKLDPESPSNRRKLGTTQPVQVGKNEILAMGHYVDDPTMVLINFEE
jgi:hypothetical protein